MPQRSAGYPRSPFPTHDSTLKELATESRRWTHTTPANGSQAHATTDPSGVPEGRRGSSAATTPGPRPTQSASTPKRVPETSHQSESTDNPDTGPPPRANAAHANRSIPGRPTPAGSQRVAGGRAQRPPQVHAPPKMTCTPKVVPESAAHPDQRGRRSPTGSPTVVCVRIREASKQPPVRQVASRHAGRFEFATLFTAHTTQAPAGIRHG